MPPSDRVKNSSTDGPMPSSGPRTVFDRHTPAKKKLGSSSGVRHAAQPMTGIAVSAAWNWRYCAVRFLRARQIMPGCTVAHSWKAGISSSASLIFLRTWCSYASMNEFMTTSPMRDTGW